MSTLLAVLLVGAATVAAVTIVCWHARPTRYNRRGHVWIPSTTPTSHRPKPQPPQPDRPPVAPPDPDQ